MIIDNVDDGGDVAYNDNDSDILLFNIVELVPEET